MSGRNAKMAAAQVRACVMLLLLVNLIVVTASRRAGATTDRHLCELAGCLCAITFQIQSGQSSGHSVISGQAGAPLARANNICRPKSIVSIWNRAGERAGGRVSDCSSECSFVRVCLSVCLCAAAIVCPFNGLNCLLFPFRQNTTELKQAGRRRRSVLKIWQVLWCTRRAKINNICVMLRCIVASIESERPHSCNILSHREWFVMSRRASQQVISFRLPSKRLCSKCQSNWGGLSGRSERARVQRPPQARAGGAKIDSHPRQASRRGRREGNFAFKRQRRRQRRRRAQVSFV